jgi:hypothetical protein
MKPLPMFTVRLQQMIQQLNKEHFKKLAERYMDDMVELTELQREAKKNYDEAVLRSASPTETPSMAAGPQGEETSLSASSLAVAITQEHDESVSES